MIRINTLVAIIMSICFSCCFAQEYLLDYAEYLKSKETQNTDIHSLTKSTVDFQAPHRVMFIVHQDVENQVTSKINVVLSQLKRDGIHGEIHIFESGDHVGLKKYLILNRKNLKGCVLVGELPLVTGNVDLHHYSEASIVDTYYMALDSEWSDSDNDGHYDQITFTDKNDSRYMDIWVSRIFSLDGKFTGDDSTITSDQLYSNYLNKLIEYRNGKKIYKAGYFYFHPGKPVKYSYDKRYLPEKPFCDNVRALYFNNDLSTMNVGLHYNNQTAFDEFLESNVEFAIAKTEGHKMDKFLSLGNRGTRAIGPALAILTVSKYANHSSAHSFTFGAKSNNIVAYSNSALVWGEGEDFGLEFITPLSSNSTFGDSIISARENRIDYFLYTHNRGKQKDEKKVNLKNSFTNIFTFLLRGDASVRRHHQYRVPKLEILSWEEKDLKNIITVKVTGDNGKPLKKALIELKVGRAAYGAGDLRDKHNSKTMKTDKKGLCTFTIRSPKNKRNQLVYRDLCFQITGKGRKQLGTVYIYRDRHKIYHQLDSTVFEAQPKYW